MTTGQPRCGFVSFVGRTNVGKSTLINALTEVKVNIVTPVTQTTHLPVRAILTENDIQCVLVDTPGIHKPQDGFGKELLRRAEIAASGSDLLVAVVEPGDMPRGGTLFLLDWLTKWSVPTMLLINKVDRIAKGSPKVRETAEKLSEVIEFEQVMLTSATQGLGVDDLRAELLRRMPPGEHHYPEDWVTDIPQTTFVAEIIREKVMRLTREELPHQVQVEVDSLTQDEPGGTFRIKATLYCARAGQKRILIGHKGHMIREIGTLARKELEETTGCPVVLKTHVEVKKDWRAKPKRSG